MHRVYFPTTEVLYEEAYKSNGRLQCEVDRATNELVLVVNGVEWRALLQDVPA